MQAVQTAAELILNLCLSSFLPYLPSLHIFLVLLSYYVQVQIDIGSLRCRLSNICSVIIGHNGKKEERLMLQHCVRSQYVIGKFCCDSLLQKRSRCQRWSPQGRGLVLGVPRGRQLLALVLASEPKSLVLALASMVMVMALALTPSLADVHCACAI